MLNSNDNEVELTLHGLYHCIDNNKIEDFDSESKEEKEKQKIRNGLQILSDVDLPKPVTFIPPAWYLSRQAIEALKDFDFEIAEARSALEFIRKGKKYLISPVINWDKYGNREKNKETLKENDESVLPSCA